MGVAHDLKSQLFVEANRVVVIFHYFKRDVFIVAEPVKGFGEEFFADALTLVFRQDVDKVEPVARLARKLLAASSSCSRSSAMWSCCDLRLHCFENLIISSWLRLAETRESHRTRGKFIHYVGTGYESGCGRHAAFADA